MAKFKYRARTKEGELQVGQVAALSKNEASSILSSHGLYVLVLDEVDEDKWYGRFLNYANRVKTKDLMVFTRQFATLLSARIPLDDALITLRKQTRNPSLFTIVSEISADIEAGLSLSQSLEKYDKVFSGFYVSMVRSAEITGRIGEAVGFLADYIEKQSTLVAKVRNALIYPIVMIALFFVVGGIMVVVVFPQIGPVFEEAGVELPIFTRILLSGGIFLSQWWWAVLAVLITMVFVAADYFRTPEGRTLADEILFRIPVVNKLLRELYVARFAESLSVLIKGGIPITQAVEITGHTVGNASYREALHEVSGDLQKGEQLSQSLAKHEALFPPLVSQMTAVGESTGRLDTLLQKISDFYAREVDGLVGSLVELIQPLLMVVIGVLVGVLFASILIPIYNLAQTF
jgi:type IV pilus assembly protein PilC